MGMVLAQFPWSLPLEEGSFSWLKGISENLPGIPIAAEFRHRRWYAEEPMERVLEMGFTPVSVDLPRLHGLPDTGLLRGKGTVYLRLHGRNREKWWGNTPGVTTIITAGVSCCPGRTGCGAFQKAGPTAMFSSTTATWARRPLTRRTWKGSFSGAVEASMVKYSSILLVLILISGCESTGPSINSEFPAFYLQDIQTVGPPSSCCFLGGTATYLPGPVHTSISLTGKRAM